jgi:hypothetical protein
MKHLFVMTCAIALVAGGCNCNCSGNSTIGGKDGGTGGGSGGGTGGGGGGTGGTGGTGGGFGPFDAGDGTTTGGVTPGSWQLDGGNGDYASGVKLDPNGNLILGTGSSELYFMWIANSLNDWVSKYDTRTGKETARYFSVIPKDCSGSAGPPCANGAPVALQPNHMNATTPLNGAMSPSRTAIDLFGDVWIANRAPSLQGSVTKIANDIANCIDRNGNGTIETSSDKNGDGVISTNPADGEMIIPADYANPNQYDECVLFTQPVGTPGSDVAVRALAISVGLEGTAGDVWAGIYREKRFYKLNPNNGAVVGQSGMLNKGPYGAIVDRNQKLWAVYPGVAELALIDTTNGVVVMDNIVPPAGTVCGAYALGVDAKSRIWLPGLYSGSVACRYDHSTQTWTSFDFSTFVCSQGRSLGRPRGIAVDEQGVVYMSADYGAGMPLAQLIRFNAETGVVQPFGTDGCIDTTDSNSSLSIGVGLDGDGHPWTNNYSGNVFKVDKTTGAVTKTAQQPSGLYTYSDFTGYQLKRFTAPRGVYRKDFIACDEKAEWLSVIWDSTAPAGTTVKVWVKVANTLADLNSNATMRYGPFTTSPADLKAAGVPKGKFFRVEFELTSTGMSTPVLKSFSVKWTCGGIN